MNTSTKQSALTTLGATRAKYVLLGRRALLQTLLALDNATADDVRDGVPLPASTNPKLFGAVPGALAKQGIIMADGYRPSIRPEAHGRPVQVWRLVDREAARRWLRDNPEPEPIGADAPCPVDGQGQGLLFGDRRPPAPAEGW